MPYRRNRRLMSKILLALTSVCFMTVVVSAQKIEYGGGLGYLTTKGEIANNYNPLNMGVGGHGMYRYHLSNALALRGSLNAGYYTVNSTNNTNNFQEIRGAITKGGIMELAAVGEYKFFNASKLVKQKECIPYIFGGLGFAYTINKAKETSSTDKNRENFGTVVLPYGFGVKYRFKGPWAIAAEYGNRMTFTDKIQRTLIKINDTNGLGASNNAVYAPGLSTAEIRKNAGNTANKDQYTFLNFTLSYTIFTIVCPNKE
jgi:hypothetical protein